MALVKNYGKRNIFMTTTIENEVLEYMRKEKEFNEQLKLSSLIGRK